VTYSSEIVEQIKRKHRLDGEPTLLPFTGMVNEAWAIGDEYILRINLREECDDEAPREAVVVPLVRAAGLRSPELIVFDDSREIVPRPYTIYRRADGVLLGSLDIDPTPLEHLYREIGRQLSLLHKVAPPSEIQEPQTQWDAWSTRKQIVRAADEGYLPANDVEEIDAFLSVIEHKLEVRKTDSLIHKDIHPWNLMVDPDTYALTAILDWGDTSRGDVASEFASMPLVAVRSMFAGYEEAGEQVTESMIARSLYEGFGLACWEIREGDMQNYRRQWWRMPAGGWREYRAFVQEMFPTILN